MAKTASKIKLVICRVTTKAEEFIWDAFEGRELLRRARKKIVFAKREHCKLVMEGKIKIPRGWKKYRLLIFPEVFKAVRPNWNWVHCLYWSWNPPGWRLVQHNIDCTMYDTARMRIVGTRKK